MVLKTENSDDVQIISQPKTSQQQRHNRRRPATKSSSPTQEGPHQQRYSLHEAKATLYSLQDAEDFHVLSNCINKSKASKRCWLAFLNVPYTREDEKVKKGSGVVRKDPSLVYNSGWSVEIAIPKKAKREAGDHGEGTLPAPWEESRPAFVIMSKPKRFSFLPSHGMKLSRSSIGWETTPRPVDHFPTGIRNSSPPKKTTVDEAASEASGSILKGIRGVLVDDLFWFQEELGIETSDFMRALFDQEWLQYRTTTYIHFPYLNTLTGEPEKGRR
ncbi:uncharacterized protein FFB14_01925 [Fusarium fujikuroi]|nr:uncharacterized protein FFB14_01925 [Fusarium fujikuroi]